LTKRDAQIATEELLWLLSLSPRGQTTRELIGTPRFHGHRTLTARQVARLLRASGFIEHCYDGYGCKAPSRWTLKAEEKI
jgi:hypothetical protein